MARDAVTITTLSTTALTTTPTGTTINTTNGAYITPTRGSRLLIRCTNTITNATKVVTVNAGDNPPSLRAALGALALTIPQSGDIMFSLETARYMQDDGNIHFDFGTGMTGAISAIEIPQGAS